MHILNIVNYEDYCHTSACRGRRLAQKEDNNGEGGKENKEKMPSDRLDYAVSSVVSGNLPCLYTGRPFDRGRICICINKCIYTYIYVHYLYRRDLMNVDVEEGR